MEAPLPFCGVSSLARSSAALCAGGALAIDPGDVFHWTPIFSEDKFYGQPLEIIRVLCLMLLRI